MEWRGDWSVVLPTGVKTGLPFACNAPFVQDPARVKIKDPEISPTNRWLLTRIGKLAAGAMLEWLGSTSLELAERASAYRLLPPVSEEDNSLEKSCAAIVNEAFGKALKECRFSPSEDGQLAAPQQIVAVPSVLLEVWSTQQVVAFFVDDQKSILNRKIGREDQKKLHDWGFLSQLGTSDILNSLETRYLPKPDSWEQLLSLWSYTGSRNRALGPHRSSNLTGGRQKRTSMS